MPVLLAIGVVVVLALQLPRSVSSAKQVQPLQVTDLRVSHKAGQSFITWREVGGPSMGPAPIAEQVEKSRAQSGSVQYRVYRSTAPITTLDRATPIAELPQLSGSNTAHEGRRANAVARRYVVRDGEAPLSLDHGVFVFNPATAGEGIVCRRGGRPTGQEQRTDLGGEHHNGGGTANCEDVENPVLQRRDQRHDFMLSRAAQRPRSIRAVGSKPDTNTPR